MNMPGFDGLSFAQMHQAEFIEKIYQDYLADRLKVDESWRAFFDGMEFAASSSLTGKYSCNLLDIKVYQLIEAYRSLGHVMAQINPIATEKKELPKALDPQNYDLTDFSQEVNTFGLLDAEKAPLEKVYQKLQEIYSQKIGFEYRHIQDPNLVAFIQNQVEHHFFEELSNEQKKHILDYLNRSELFESFLHTKFVGQKRFSLEGLETFIPVVRAIINFGADLGIEEIVLCMSHRGRLNVMNNIFERPYSLVFQEFEEHYEPGEFEGTGDVKYHKGYSAEILSDSQKKVHISIPPNSSHLESVNAIMLGQVKAKQVHKNDIDKSHILGVQVHGDASAAGQGVMYEVMQMTHLKGYDVGGSIHIILDNQIGFTTLPESSRSTRYSSDIALTFGCPVFHVNAEDPTGCVLATKLALMVKQKFKCDIFIHLNGYRKYGHNEGDEPSYTQPLQYKIIREKKPIKELYVEELVSQKVIDKETFTKQEEEFKAKLQKALDLIKDGKENHFKEEEILGNRWAFWKDAKLKNVEQIFKKIPTQVKLELLKELAIKITELPQDFTPHRKIAQLLQMRREAILDPKSSAVLDWGLVEHLAFASILFDQMPIRLAGQDSRRGTFSHRHAVIIDQNNAKPYYPLSHLKEGQGLFTVYDSPLSEYGCLGFEYGYSISTPKGLVIWEAQFGDFANGAQIIIDAYLANAEQKWNRLSDLVLLLPHGYEGQGPEHSSARVERFLQLAGENNFILANLTTPAQLFHLLRRQVLKGYRKPLVIFTPKGLLRHKLCVSSVQDLTDGSFEYLIDDPKQLQKVQKLVFCSGRIYYDLFEKREELGLSNIALVRLEQIYPIDPSLIKAIIDKYQGFKECFWVQEEHENMGCWRYIQPHLNKILPNGQKVNYIGREEQASTATGSHKRHKVTLDKILTQLFEGLK